jgi:hypothetical protein
VSGDLFDGLSLHPVNGDVLRNIKSIRRTQELFDDLSGDPGDWEVAKQAELSAKPQAYTDQPVLRRPFERARYFNAIRFPFENWARSRYSDGNWGVWYGASELAVTVHETVHHWLCFLRAAGMAGHNQDIVGDRRVYKVRCEAALLDLRTRVRSFPALVDKDDYAYTQDVGRRIHREGHPGLVSCSARTQGDVYAVFREQVLSDPRNHCDLTYILRPGADRVRVERQRGRGLMAVEL